MREVRLSILLLEEPMKVKPILSLFCCAAMAMQMMAAGQESSGGTTAAAASSNPTPAISVKEIKELRQKIAAQQKQIELLQKSVAEQQNMLDTTVRAVEAGAANANVAAPGLSRANDSGPQSLTLIPAAQGPSAEKVKTSPLSFKIGGADFTPFGFVDLTFFNRSTNVGSGIGTSFGGIPFNNSTAGRLSESNFSAQNSRLGLRVDSTVMGAKVLGYFEADFLGSAPTNVFVTSNSNTFRMRNLFVDVQKGKLELLGGQDWSLLTPNKKGVSPLPSDIFYTQNMDTNYQVGLIWSRQAQFRVAYHPNEHVHMAVSLENPQQYVGSTGVAFPSALNTLLTPQFNTGSNTYSVPNQHPDIIGKVAFDFSPGGLHQHFEIAGLQRTFRYFNSLPGINKTFTANAGGGSVNGNFEVHKNVHLIANTFFSDGGGRYIFGLGPDLMVRPNGNISPIHSYSTLDGFEANLSKNLLLYSYYGGAYYGRDTSIDTGGKLVGYGFGGPGLSTNSNRSIQEYTIGLTPTFFKSEQHGALQMITQYSYVWRNPWAIPEGGPKNAKTNMVYIDLRYTLP
jgi:hypothetical protein